MKFIEALSAEQKQELHSLVKNNPHHRVRQRAQAILLSARGYMIEELADMFNAHRNTISEWLDLWRTEGLHAATASDLAVILEDAPRSGRPSSLTAEQEQMLLEEIETNPKSIDGALRQVKKRQG